MIIDKKLNLDRELEYFPDGGLAFAQNVVVSNDGLTIQNEPAVVNFLTREGFDLAGFVACNEEFVLFGKDNSVVRVDKNSNVTSCDTNWKWAGGDVFGTFTYNVNNELIVAISERNAPNDVPLKVINLDRDKYSSEVGESAYVLTPDIPKSNMIDIQYVQGDKIRKGKYNFFIKYFINDEFETGWFPIGIPVFAYDNSLSSIPKTTEEEDIQAHDGATDTKIWAQYHIRYDDFYNNKNDYTNDNIKLTFDIKDNLFYTHYSIGYIINYNGGSEGRKTNKYNINNKEIIITNNSQAESVDELTVGQFNIYNVKTMSNYKNRLYLANYKEENVNELTKDIDASKIIVSYKPDDLKLPKIEVSTSEDDDEKIIYNYDELKHQWKSKPGRAAVYNFYIHYVYSNGNFTDGIKIGSVNYHPNGGKLDDGTVALEHYINTNGDLLFVTPINESFNVSKLIFSGIKMYSQFVGYFISYEKPEYINIGEGLITPDKSIRVYSEDGEDYKYIPSDLFDINAYISSKVWRFYYPEFNIIGGKTNVTKLVPTGYHYDIYGSSYIINSPRLRATNPATGYLLIQNDFNNEKSSENITKSEIISPNNIDNLGKEGYLKLTSEREFTRNEGFNEVQSFTAINENKNIYVNKNKQLVSLGYIKYQNYVSDDETYTYGEEDVPYNYDFYRCFSSIYFFKYGGIIVSETEGNPIAVNEMFVDPTKGTVDDKITVMQRRSKGEEYYSYEQLPNTNYYPHIGIVKYWHETHYPLFLKELNQEPRIIFRPNYAINCNATTNCYLDSDKIYQIRNIVLAPAYVNDLYKLDASYYDYTGKLLINYDESLVSNQMTEYVKTVRRSDVIQSESIVNAWRYFRPENYKIVTENKGKITNVTGIGNYLFVHCEHSLFVFDITDSLQALDKNVQLLQPDTFEVNYKEVFTADKGYGGLQDFESWICDEFGYMFYDKSAAKIYRFDAGQLKDVTEDVEDFIKMFKPNTIWMGNDRPRNRIIMNLRNSDESVMLSYNINSGGWASTHSYISNYKFIGLKDKLLIPNIVGDVVNIAHYDSDKFNKTTLPVGDIAIDDSIKSFIDVTFTSPNYNKIKVLDFITYILNKEPNDNFDILQIEIYTNCCYSGVIDISQERKKIAEYKKPYYDFERWNFNYFRNRLDKIENGDVFDRLTGKKNNLPEKVQRGYDNALISGKYVVIRFAFKNTTKEVNIKDIHAYFKP